MFNYDKSFSLMFHWWCWEQKQLVFWVFLLSFSFLFPHSFVISGNFSSSVLSRRVTSNNVCESIHKPGFLFHSRQYCRRFFFFFLFFPYFTSPTYYFYLFFSSKLLLLLLLYFNKQTVSLSMTSFFLFLPSLFALYYHRNHAI